MNASETVKKSVPLSINPSACIDVRAESRVCGACVDICPEECLKISGRSAQVDSASCVECGLCVTACPSSAVSLGSYLEGRIADIIDMEISRSPTVSLYCSKTAYSGGERQKGLFHCLGVLGAGRLVNMVMSEAESVTLNGACRKCVIVNGERQIQQAVDMANNTTEKLGRGRCIRFDACAPENVREKEIAEASSRRGFLFGMARMAAKQAVSKIKVYNTSETSNGKLAPIPLPTRKRMLNTIVKNAGPMQFAFTESDSPFRLIRISSSCVLCNACSTYCPTGALTLRDYPDRVALELTSASCVKCQGCAKLCPENAISYADGFSAEEALAERPALMAEKGKAQCVTCQKPFIPSSDGQAQCQGCMKVDKFQSHLFSMYINNRRSHES
ncbi:MAG: 4Fe-4S binding protein [Nitrospinae bacterium]|nr:4Fe-4S binding protein [Nitrospinota bacterium]